MDLRGGREKGPRVGEARAGRGKKGEGGSANATISKADEGGKVEKGKEIRREQEMEGREGREVSHREHNKELAAWLCLAPGRPKWMAPHESQPQGLQSTGLSPWGQGRGPCLGQVCPCQQ